MRKRFYAAVLAVILGAGFITGGCGNGAGDGSIADSSKSAATQAAGAADYGEYNMSADDAGSAEIAADDAGFADTAEEKAVNGAASLEGSGTDTAIKQNEKLIYTYNYSVETKEFEKFTEQIMAKTKQLGGYVENSEVNGSAADGINRSANITLRIPADKMNQLTSMLDTESNVTYRSESTDNVTLQYVDMESHVKALRTEQEALLRLMEKAEKLKDIITLQSQLTQVRYEIESYESQLRTYDNLVDYSTMHLYISEVERTTTVASTGIGFGEEVKNKFSDNMYAVGQWLRAVAVWFLSSLPILVPFAAVVIIVLVIIRKWSKRRNKDRTDRTETVSGAYRSIYKDAVSAKPSSGPEEDNPQQDEDKKQP